MTGYARVRREAATGAVTVTLRAVNHRFLDLRWQLPGEWESLQPELEKLLRARLQRGHVEVRLAWEDAAAAAPAQLNAAVLDAYLAAHQELSRRVGSAAPANPADILRFPGMFTPAGAEPEAWAELVAPALCAALDQLQAMRAVEGAALAKDLNARLDALAEGARAIEAERPALEAGLRDKLERRLQEWLGSAAAAPAPERVIQEAALLAERSDISEELTRLAAHLAQARALLAAGGAVGKKLDFLTQELGREVNTLCSKTTSASPAALRITDLGLTLKAELEKFREQIQNLE
jgi:uncharacterized protein (TIGR00255 family)